MNAGFNGYFGQLGIEHVPAVDVEASTRKADTRDKLFRINIFRQPKRDLRKGHHQYKGQSHNQNKWNN